MQKNIILVHGAPGSGKDTNANILSQKIKSCMHISVGDLYRSTRCEDSSEHARQMSNDMNAGRISSDDTCVGVVIDKIKLENKHTFILTGFPQRENEIKLFINIVKQNGFVILGTIFLNANKNNCLYRMKLRGVRIGEIVGLLNKEEYYLNRFNNFEKNKNNLIKNLSKFMIVQELNSNNNIEIVSKDFIIIYNNFLKLGY